MSKKTVSVIVPSYNVASTVVRCLDSVYAQTYEDLEVVVVNDGSTDNTLQVLRDYRRAHMALVLIDQHNQGLSAARNTGLDAATGEYIYFLDSDDYLGPEEIELLVDAMDEGMDMAVGGMTYVDADGNVLRTVCDPACHLEELGYWDRVYGNPNGNSVEYIVSCGKLYRANLFKQARFALGKIHEDEFMLHHIVKQCGGVAVVPVSKLYYVQNNASITHRPSARSKLDIVEAFLDRNRYFLDRGFYDLFWTSLCQVKAALVDSYCVISNEVEMSRWHDLKEDWNRAFAVGRRHFDLRDRHCVSCLAYRCFPTFFNKRNSHPSDEGTQ